MKALSLKLQITFLVILLIAGLVGAFSWTVISGKRNMIISELYRTVILQARNIALSSSKALLHRDPEFELHPLITRVKRSDRNIVSVSVVNSKGIIKGSEDLMSIDKKYMEPDDLNKAENSISLLSNEKLYQNEDIVYVSVPVMDQSEIIGSVSIRYSKQKVKSTILDIYTRMLKIGLAALVTGSLISLAMSFYISRPVKKLEYGARKIGEGNLDTRINIRSVKELKVLADSFNDMARGLKESRLALIENERMQKELELAHEIQSTLLPSRIPRLRNLEIDAYYKPAAQVGGDYFDLVSLDNHRLMLIVGDVSGKGVPGLVVMAMVRILIRGLAAEGRNPAEMLRRLNLLLGKNMKKNMFVTLFCGIFNIIDTKMIFASAAHMPLILYKKMDSSVSLLKTRTKPLGIFPDRLFSSGLEEYSLDLNPGDLIFQFTDGLSEMTNDRQEEFGIDRIARAVKNNAENGSERVITDLQNRYAAYRGKQEQSDDLTMLAARVLPQRVGADSDSRVDSDREELLVRGFNNRTG